MASGLMGRAAKYKRHYQKHRKLGLCFHCSKKVVEGKSMCQYHLDYHKKMYFNRKFRNENKEVTKDGY